MLYQELEQKLIKPSVQTPSLKLRAQSQLTLRGFTSTSSLTFQVNMVTCTLKIKIPSPYIRIQGRDNTESKQSKAKKSLPKSENKLVKAEMSGILKKLWWCGAKSFHSERDSNVPEEGHVRVFVGKDMQFKLDMEANYLNHPLFENLLKLSEEEFGYSYDGALRIACEIDFFQYLLHLLKTSDPSAHYMELHDLISKFYRDNGAAGSSSSSSSAHHHQ